MRFKTVKIVLSFFILSHFLVFDLYANQLHKDLCTDIGFKENTTSFKGCVKELREREKEKIRKIRQNLNQEVRDLPRKNQMLESEKKEIAQRLFKGDKKKYDELRRQQIINGVLIAAAGLGLMAGAAALSAPAAGAATQPIAKAPLWMCGSEVWSGNHCSEAIWGLNW